MATYAQAPLVPGDIYESAERFAAEREPSLACLAGPGRESAVEEAWNEAVRLGWTGVLIPTELGGSGGDVADLAAIVQGLGRKGLPFALSHCAKVAQLLNSSGPASPGASLLTAIANGSARVCALLDVPWLDGEWKEGSVLVSGSREAEGVPRATHYVVACRQGGEIRVLLVPAPSEGVRSERFDRPDGGVGVRVTFSKVNVGSSAILASGASVPAVIQQAARLGELMTCLEAEATIAALLEEVVRHLTTRVQFGAPLAELQVLRHKTVDIYLANRSLGALVSRALRMWATAGAEAHKTIVLASARLREVAREIAKTGIQLHGGMGLAEDLLAARLCRRLLMMEFKLPREAGESHVS